MVVLVLVLVIQDYLEVQDGNKSTRQCGAGGNGTATPITGTPATYAGGGGGGRLASINPAQTRGLGGTGGGGAGAPSSNQSGQAATANTGGGGGGASGANPI